MDEKEPEFEKQIKEMDEWGRKQYIPGAFANAHTWSKLPWLRAKGWRRVVIVTISILMLLLIAYTLLLSLNSLRTPKTIEDYRQEFQDCFAQGGKAIPGANPLIGSCEINGKKYYYEG